MTSPSPLTRQFLRTPMDDTDDLIASMLCRESFVSQEAGVGAWHGTDLLNRPGWAGFGCTITSVPYKKKEIPDRRTVGSNQAIYLLPCFLIE